MRSKTSFSKRFAQLWKKQLWVAALSMLGFFVACPVYMLMMISRWEDWGYRETLGSRFLDTLQGNSYSSGGNMTLFMLCVMTVALIAAWNGFSYLHARSKTDLYHALPMKREILFLLQLFIGLSDYVLPAAVGLLLLAVAGGLRSLLSVKCIRALLALYAAGFVFYLLFFLLAALAMLLCGRILVGILGTLVFLGIGPLITILVKGYQATFFYTMYGYSRQYIISTGPMLLNPVLQALRTVNRLASGYLLNGLAYAACAALIVGALCVWICRIRPSEAAERAMAFGPAGEIIKVVLTSVAALTIGLFAWNMFTSHRQLWFWFGLLFGIAVFYAVIQMIYHMDIRRCFSKPVSLAAALIITLGAAAYFRYDLGGYDRYLPAQEEIASIGFSPDENSLIWESDIPEMTRTERGQIPCDAESYALLQELMEGAERYEAGEGPKIQVTGSSEYNRTIGKSVLVKRTNGSSYLRHYTVWADDIREMALKLYDREEYKESCWPILAAEPDKVTELYLEACIGEEDREQREDRDREDCGDETESGFGEDAGLEKDAGSGEESTTVEIGKNDLVKVAEALQKDLKDLTGETVRNEIPIGMICFHADLEGLGFGDGTARSYRDDWGEVSGKEGKDWYGEIYLYPSFDRTRKALEEAGYPVREPGVEGKVAQIEFAEDGRIIEDPEEIDKLLPQIQPDEYDNEWLPLKDTVYLTIYGSDGDERIIRGRRKEE